MAAKVDDLVKFKWHGTRIIVGSRIYDVKLLTSYRTGIQKGTRTIVGSWIYDVNEF